ncbi:ATP-binding protein [Streptomyces sp. NPDC005953]|uniref:ATP-binding protein n=1 Tax=unclassified Streptomyces TaxID=2593676 RepID=UPI0033D3D0C7
MQLIDPEPSLSYRMSFTVGDHAARHVRRIARSYLHDWGLDGLADTVGLGLTELLANVVRHVPGRHCALALLRLPWGVRIEVSDEGPGLPRTPAPVDPEGLDEGGRGLLLIAALADRWGVVPLTPTGKTVWFECEAPQSLSVSADLRGDGLGFPCLRQEAGEQV